MSQLSIKPIPQSVDLSLSASRAVRVQLRWHNPFSSPPDGANRIQFDKVVDDQLYRSGSIPEIQQLETQYPPGSGWSWHWSLEDAEAKPVRLWSKEAKGRVRKKRLKTRLQKKMPLFWEDLYEKEIALRPDYFAGADAEFATLHQSGGVA